MRKTKSEWKIKAFQWALSGILISIPTFIFAESDSISFQEFVANIQEGVNQTEFSEESLKQGFQDWTQELKETLKMGAYDLNKIRESLLTIGKDFIKTRTHDDLSLCLDLFKDSDNYPAIAVNPEEIIYCKAVCKVNEEDITDSRPYQVIVGFPEKEDKQVVFEYPIDGLNLSRTFQLKAPKEPGLYSIRFQKVYDSINSDNPDDLQTQWLDENGNEPSVSTILGVVLVNNPQP